MSRFSFQICVAKKKAGSKKELLRFDTKWKNNYQHIQRLVKKNLRKKRGEIVDASNEQNCECEQSTTQPKPNISCISRDKDVSGDLPMVEINSSPISQHKLCQDQDDNDQAYNGTAVSSTNPASTAEFQEEDVVTPDSKMMGDARTDDDFVDLMQRTTKLLDSFNAQKSFEERRRNFKLGKVQTTEDPSTALLTPVTSRAGRDIRPRQLGRVESKPSTLSDIEEESSESSNDLYDGDFQPTSSKDRGMICQILRRLTVQKSSKERALPEQMVIKRMPRLKITTLNPEDAQELATTVRLLRIMTSISNHLNHLKQKKSLMSL